MTRSYLAELEEAINTDRKIHGKKPLKPKEPKPDTREVKSNPSDPDSGYMVRDGKPKRFFYLDHRTTYGKHNLITDTHVTTANFHDNIPYLKRLDRQMGHFNYPTEVVGSRPGRFCTAGHRFSPPVMRYHSYWPCKEVVKQIYLTGMLSNRSQSVGYDKTWQGFLGMLTFAATGTKSRENSSHPKAPKELPDLKTRAKPLSFGNLQQTKIAPHA